MHPSSLEEMEKFVATLPPRPFRLADVGSYDVNGSYRHLFARPGWDYVGIDARPGPNVDVVIQGESGWKNVDAESFDVVISGQTLEHTLRPWIFVRELARILKRGCQMCVIAPHTWAYHPSPLDCWRVFPDGMRAILEDAGLRIISVYMNNVADTVGIAQKD